jgi:Peptidase M15
MNISTVKSLDNLSKIELLTLQKNLKTLNFDPGQLDGILGQNTLAAFRKFKQDYKLSDLDLIGPTTVKIMNLALQGKLDQTENEPKHTLQPIFSQPQTKGVINWSDFSSPISKYFTVGEVSQFSRERIVINSDHQKNVLLIAKCLDNIREQWGRPIGVTSWYRPPAVNRRVGGASQSQHLNGGAVDIYPINENIYDFQKWLDQKWDRALGYGAKRGFVHIDLRDRPKKIRWPYV